ncbi:MAG: ABC transporter permease, partial [Longimicrobiales bacterium]
MIRYAVRRILAAVPLVLGIATIIFFILNLAPGDPVARYVGPSVPPEVLAQIRTNLGLDDPIHIQYLKWMGSLLTGDFGYSLGQNRPVAGLIGEILPNTLLLSGAALLIAFLAGIVLGVVQAVRQYSLTDQVLSVAALFFYSMPSFWLALMLILIFSLGARTWDWPIWFPASGMQSVDYAFLSPVERAVDVIRHLVLPAGSLALVLTAGIARYMRGSMLEVIRQDYVRTARAKGLAESRVIFKHALRNALGPVITLFGLYLPVIFSGTVFVEAVFGWPGMGSLIVNAIGQRDYP